MLDLSIGVNEKDPENVVELHSSVYSAVLL
jgi:hypothetical protein